MNKQVLARRIAGYDVYSKVLSLRRDLAVARPGGAHIHRHGNLIQGLSFVVESYEKERDGCFKGETFRELRERDGKTYYALLGSIHQCAESFDLNVY